jgi:hypothetical protein
MEIEEYYTEWTKDKLYCGEEESWAIDFAIDWQEYKEEQLNIHGVVNTLVCPVCSRTDCKELIGIKCNDCQEFTEP